MGQVLHSAPHAIHAGNESVEFAKSIGAIAKPVLIAIAVVAVTCGIVAVDVQLVEGGYLTQPHSH